MTVITNTAVERNKHTIVSSLHLNTPNVFAALVFGGIFFNVCFSVNRLFFH